MILLSFVLKANDLALWGVGIRNGVAACATMFNFPRWKLKICRSWEVISIGTVFENGTLVKSSRLCVVCARFLRSKLRHAIPSIELLFYLLLC